LTETFADEFRPKLNEEPPVRARCKLLEVDLSGSCRTAEAARCARHVDLRSRSDAKLRRQALGVVHPAPVAVEEIEVDQILVRAGPDDLTRRHSDGEANRGAFSRLQANW
jgi:hypothetical protein